MERRAAVAIGLVLACCHCALALDPSLEISQYAHNSWLGRDGFPKGRVRSITQSPDGYLWLGTEFGLVRFDGSKNIAWTPPAGQRLPSNNIRSLVAARDGTLWIGTLEGLASWKDGKLVQYPALAKQNVYSLLEDRDGTIWAGTFALPTARLCEIRGLVVTCHGQDGSVGQWVESLCEDSRGRVWAGTGTGLWRWKPGPPERSSLPHSVDSAQALVEDEDRSGLFAIANAIWRFVDGEARKYPLAGVRGPLTPIHMLRDRDGGLWIGTLQRGVVHVYRGRTDVFGQRDGLSSDDVDSLFEDREGNVWVATAEGLDRFRGFVATSISVEQGLSSPSTMTALVARDGAIWTSTLDGLNRWNKGAITIYRAHAPPSDSRLPDSGGVARTVHEVTDSGLADNQPGSLFQDDLGRIWVSSVNGISRFQDGHFTRVNGVPGGWVNVIAGDLKGGMWIADQDQGLYHLVDDKVVEQTPWAKLGHTVAASMAADPIRGGLWLGFFEGGIAHFAAGQVRASFDLKDGLGAGRVMDLRFDGDGVLWASTEGGLSRIKDERVVTLNSRNGLPCDGVHWAVEDNARDFWLYTACGLVRVPRSELQAWTSQPGRKIQPTVFDASDGVGLKALLTGYTPRVGTGADGKIWFAHFESINVIDPMHLTFNAVLPPVHIEDITADGKIYDPRRGRPLPALVRNLTIDYTALSFAAPEKMRFKYKLEGHDQDWRDAGIRRQAFYNDLEPRKYRFRVIAANNSGVWNMAGDSREFSIAPAYYQTGWFEGLFALALLSGLWGIYQFRLHQVAREFNVRMEGRVGERTRIARDLHDTLLQSFQGLMLRLQVVENLLPEGNAKEQLATALERADQAIEEGRRAVSDLRASAVTTNDLPLAVRALGDELTTPDSAPFHLFVEGSARDLHPVIRDELYRITREALRNAFIHARAAHIETEITYGDRIFRLRIRDDGAGIPPEILEGGRVGHYGLSGMRERARQIGGKLEIWSGTRAGTEVELTIPAKIAYGSGPGRPLFGLFRRKQA